MDKISTFAKRLRALLDVKRLTQAELSRKTGISESSVSHYLKGDWEAKQDVVYAIAVRYDVSEAWLMGYDVPMSRVETALYNTAVEKLQIEQFLKIPSRERDDLLSFAGGKSLGAVSQSISQSAMRIAAAYDLADDHTRQLVDLALKPFLIDEKEVKTILKPATWKSSVMQRDEGFEELDTYDQPSAAGLGNYLDTPVTQREQYPAGYIPKGTSFGVLISGESMEPKIHDRSTAFVQATPAVDDGEVGIFVLNGQSYCKQLVIDRAARVVRLHSFNEAYPDIVVKGADELRTIGRVLGSYPK